MPAEFEIIPFTQHSLDACSAVYVAAFAAEPWFEDWPLDSARLRLREFSEAPRSRGLVALDREKRAVAFVLGSYLQGQRSTALRVAELCVHPAWQRHGLGGMLMRQLEQVASEDGADTAYLITGPELVRFYEALGYRRQDDWIAMTRVLPANG
jgi:predicted N-acetyltransferase YhbS